MKQIALGATGPLVPAVGLGCFRMVQLDRAGACALVETAIAHDAPFFDVADSYHSGESERILGQAIKDARIDRDRLTIQTKCGIIQQPDGKILGYDQSRRHILDCVDGSLRRMQIEAIDVLLLHRPDALIEPEEVAAAFDELKSSGKVRHFGVSNQHPRQIELLKKYLTVPILVNQLQLSIAHKGMIDQGVNVNMENAASIDHDGGVLDYCRLMDITIQPWSPFLYGFFEGVFIGSDKYPELNRVLEATGEKYGVSSTTMAIAWLLRHPANMQPIVGTTRPSRLIECLAAGDVYITREEWYEIYRAAGNPLP